MFIRKLSSYSKQPISYFALSILVLCTFNSRTSYFNKHIVLFNRTSYLIYRTLNRSRTMCISYYIRHKSTMAEDKTLIQQTRYDAKTCD